MVVIGHYISSGVTAWWHFRTIHDGLEYRNAQIGTDNPCLCDGHWVLHVIGPDTLPLGEFVLSAIVKWKFIGRWADNGTDYDIIGIDSMEV